MKRFMLYKIYYSTETGKDVLVYLGRTTQPLNARLRGHFFKKPMQRSIDINKVSKIEFAEFSTMADMYLYEIYLINLLKPCLNVDDCAKDQLTFTLPWVDFKEYNCELMDKWRKQINDKDYSLSIKKSKMAELEESKALLRKQRRQNLISEDEFWDKYDEILKEINVLTDEKNNFIW